VVGRAPRRRSLRGALAPDGYGRVELGGRSLAFLLELDRGSEPHARLQDKARRYARELPASDLAEQRPLLLLLVPSAARAARATAELGSETPAVVHAPAADQEVEVIDVSGGRRLHSSGRLGGCQLAYIRLIRAHGTDAAGVLAL